MTTYGFSVYGFAIYAAAICAGSSMFMWSATAGFILSGKVNGAKLAEEDGNVINWGVGQYFKYGFVNYAIQISVALVVMRKMQFWITIEE